MAGFWDNLHEVRSKDWEVLHTVFFLEYSSNRKKQPTINQV